jgi:hypothetical protein
MPTAHLPAGVGEQASQKSCVIITTRIHHPIRPNFPREQSVLLNSHANAAAETGSTVQPGTAPTCRGGELETQEGPLSDEAKVPELWVSMWDRRMVVAIDESEAAPSTHPCPRLHEGSKFVGIFSFVGERPHFEASHPRRKGGPDAIFKRHET